MNGGCQSRSVAVQAQRGKTCLKTAGETSGPGETPESVSNNGPRGPIAMNTLKKIVSAAVVAATALTAVGAAAQAGEWRGRGHGYGYGPGPSHYALAPRPYYGHGNYQRRDRTGERIAAGVAIGVGAVILGSIIANQNRSHYRGYRGY